LVRLRLNGLQIAQVTADQWTWNYGTYPLYLFRREWTTLPFNGNFYGLIIRWKLSTDKQIKSVEKLLAKNTWITI
jgi:hypothetical protein